MSVQRHGLSIGIERIDNQFFVTFTAQGTLTHEDYQIITPMLDNALAAVKQPRVKVLIDATQLKGWELQAAWDDFKLGLKHGGEFEKVAIVGHQRWQQWLAKLGSWFISGEVAYFEDEQSALTWLH